MTKTTVALSTVQETLLITLWARAVEARKADPILRDTKSLEILEQIDYDFSKLATASLLFSIPWFRNAYRLSLVQLG